MFPGDVVVRVKAEDGDRGNPRDIRYGLISEGNPFTPFFNITDTTGTNFLHFFNHDEQTCMFACDIFENGSQNFVKYY